MAVKFKKYKKCDFPETQKGGEVGIRIDRIETIDPHPSTPYTVVTMMNGKEYVLEHDPEEVMMDVRTLVNSTSD